MASFASCARALEATGRGHAVRGVQRHDRDARPAGGDAVGEEGTGEGEGQQHQRRDPQRQQQQFPQVSSGLVLDGRALEERHGRELHARFGLALQQVEHERHGGSGRPGEEQRGEKGQHQSGHLAGG